MNKRFSSYVSKSNATTIIILICSAIFSVSIYQLWSINTYRVGFPLDDAWIHQTYARNLVLYKAWVYTPGVISAGSTAPLWTMILALGYAIDVDHLFWAFTFGWILLCMLGFVGYICFTQLTNIRGWLATLSALFLIFEWHLVWSAASGMETVLFALFILVVLTGIISKWKNWFVIGVIIGLSVLVRPDGITLLGPAALAIILSPKSSRENVQTLAKLLIGFILFFTPYLLINYQIAGTWWPNTFYAKQAEYQSLLELPFLYRYSRLIILPLIGVGVLLVPGFVYITYQNLKSKNWDPILGIVWFLGYIFMYAIRLPLNYQHGRYLIPAMPVFFIWGMAGTAIFIRSLKKESIKRILGRSLLLASVLLLFAFWFLGGRSYARDVAIIETEMVQSALWIKENTSEEDLIGAHDIGALGYFSERRILDMAGLISPEVIDFIRDEEKLAIYLDQEQVRYLMTFPSWYPELVDSLEIRFITASKFSTEAGGENMAVYLWDEDY